MLFVICPTQLANGALVTADLPAGLLFLASLPAIWWVLHEITPGSLIVCGLVLAGLFLTKYSAVIIVPVAGLLVLLRLTDARPLSIRCWGTWTVMGRGHLLAVIGAAVLVQAVIIWAMIWLSFGCRFEALNEPVPGRDHLRPGWEKFLGRFDFPRTTGQLIRWTRRPASAAGSIPVLVRLHAGHVDRNGNPSSTAPTARPVLCRSSRTASW